MITLLVHQIFKPKRFPQGDELKRPGDLLPNRGEISKVLKVAAQKKRIIKLSLFERVRIEAARVRIEAAQLDSWAS